MILNGFKLILPLKDSQLKIEQILFNLMEIAILTLGNKP